MNSIVKFVRMNLKHLPISNNDLVKKTSILCVDDDPSSLAFLKSNLETENDSFKVITSVSVQEALERIESEEINVIVVDCKPPSLNGLKILEILRNQGNEIPVIFLVNECKRENVRKALNLGVNRYIQRTGNHETLFSILEYAIIQEMRFKKVNQSIKEIENRYRILSEQTLLGVFIFQNHMVKYINQTAADIFGHSIEEIMSWKNEEAYIEKIHPDDRDFILEQAMKKEPGKIGVADKYDVRIITKNGTIKWVEVYSVSIQYNGKLAEFVTFKDISDREEVEKALIESEDLFRTIVENSHVGIGIIDSAFTIIYCNEVLAKITGYSIDEINGQDFRKFLGEENRDMVSDLFISRQRGEQVLNKYELEIESKNGEIKQVETIVNTIEDLRGNQITVSQVLDITESRKAEIALKESEERFRSVVESSHEAIVIVDDKYLFSYANEKACELYGYSHEEIVGFDSRKTIAQENLEMVVRRDRSRLNGEEVIDRYEYWIRRKDGEKRLVQISLDIITDINNRKFTVGQLLDITERRINEEALKNSEKRYRLLAENVNDVIWLMDVNDRRITYATPSVESLVKYNDEEILDLSLKDFFSPESLIKAKRIFIDLEDNINQGIDESQSYELVLIRKDGVKIWTETIFTLIFDFDQNMSSILGITRNIEERKRAEKALRESEEKYRMLVEKLEEGVVSLNVEGNISFVNPKMLSMLKYSEEELINSHWRILYSKEEYVKIEAEREKRLRGETSVYDSVLLAKDGVHIPVIIGATPLYSNEGEITGILCVFNDITERKKAEKALEESEARYRSIIASMTDGVVITDVENRVVSVNMAFETILGCSGVEIIGQSIFDFIDPQSLEIYDVKNSQLFSGKVPAAEYELIYIKKNGEKLITRTAVSSVVRDNVIEGSFAVVTDISVRQELEERRSHFISMTTHELRTPLTIIKGYVDLFEKYLSIGSSDQKERYEKPLQQIDKNIHRLEKLISDVSNIGKIESDAFQLETEQINFLELLSEVINSYQMILKDQLLTEVDPDQSPIIIEGDSARLFQVLCNIIENAIQNTPDDDRKIIIDLKNETTNISVNIIDNGAGIEPKFISLIFEPFVSIPTEYHVKGTGVGLYLAKFILEAHGGRLDVKSQGKGQGSTFTLRIPKISN